MDWKSHLQLMGKYTDLQVWNKSKNLAVGIYKLTESGSFARDYRFRDQLEQLLFQYRPISQKEMN